MQPTTFQKMSEYNFPVDGQPYCYNGKNRIVDIRGSKYYLLNNEHHLIHVRRDVVFGGWSNNYYININGIGHTIYIVFDSSYDNDSVTEFLVSHDGVQFKIRISTEDGVTTVKVTITLNEYNAHIDVTPNISELLLKLAVLYTELVVGVTPTPTSVSVDVTDD